MTLALLLTAVGGAWADETPLLTIESKDYTTFTSGSKTFDDKVTVTFSNTVYNEGNTDGWLSITESLLTVAGTNGYTITSCKFYTAYGTAATGYTVEGESPSVYLSAGLVFTDANESVYLGDPGITKIEVYGAAPAPEPGVEVTTNAASEQDLFTEAWFTMLASDVTVNYTLVRDMQDETNPVTFSGLPSSGKIIVKKGSDGKYQPAEALTIQLIDPLAAAEAQNIIAADGITIKVLVGAENGQGAIDYDHDNPITLEAFLADMKPGFYWIKAESTDENSPYDGTVYSQELLLLNGYELTIAAGEYATFYKDEKLYVEDEDAVLYTIANVTATEAQLSDAIKVAPAETPLLVYNKSEQDKTFLLIPTTENADEVTPAKEFKGSVSSGELPASSSTADYYALNGKAFVWVKYAIEIGANKCWLQIGDQPAAARAMTRSITGGGDTTNMDDVRWQMEDGNYYDLQGRKVEKPNRKGIYIKGGKKVIVR